MSGLVTAAFRDEDAEAAGIRADQVLADPEKAVQVLGGPNPVPAVRNAVIQRFGGVGALLVIACEHAALERQHTDGTAAYGGASAVQAACLDRLLHEFADLGPEDLEHLLEAIEKADGLAVSEEIASTRRWLNVTYAVAARDGTDQAHRAYLEALDRVLASTRALIVT